MLYIVYAFILSIAISIYLQRKSIGLRLPFIIGIVLKIMAGIALGLLYKYYYPTTGDTYFYHSESVKLTQLLLNDFSQAAKTIFQSDSDLSNPRSLFFIKILSILNLFTFSDYWVNSALCSVFSFCGAWSLSDYLQKRDNISIWVSLSGLLVFPSSLLWSSGLLKESIVFGALCFLLKIVYKYSQNFNFKFELRAFVLAVIMLLLLVNLRYFYAAIFIPVAFSYVIACLWRRRSTEKMSFVVFLIVLMGSMFVATLVHPNLSHDYIFTVLLQNYNDVRNLSGPGDSYTLLVGEKLLSDWRILPQAIFTGLFRPLPWDLDLGVKTIVGVENLLTLFIAIVACGLAARKRKFEIQSYSILIYAILLSFAMAVASPNWGSLLRYRIGYQPFLIMLFLIVIVRSDFASTLQRKNGREQS